VSTITRAAATVLALVSLGGCSMIAGLDGIHEQACAPECGDGQATTDGSGPDAQDSAPPGDASPALDVAADQSGGDDGTVAQDTGSGPDGTASEGGDGEAMEASARDAAPDAPFDSGCGPLDTVNNCSACGAMCAAASGSQTSSMCSGPATGAGATCSYTCATNDLDCNGLAGSAPNLDGCECHAPGATASQCCSGGCPVQHTDGLTGSGYPPNPKFYDCVPALTMNSQLAQDACNNYVNAVGSAACLAYSETADASAPDSWCGGGDTFDCICWTFSGRYSGTVFDAFANGAPDPTLCYYGMSNVTFQ